MPNPSLYGDADSDFVEVDPTGRYGRYNEVLGRGASKTVYRAFDEIEGIEVAWNQVKLSNVFKSPEDLQRLCSEVHLLKTLKHKNIIKFYASWIDTKARNINFVTEMFTSGSLRQYRQRHKRVDIRAVKNWARQILRGLLYLHSHDPPIIHRDLKCDNVFVNGNQGEVKIGDLGLAAILRKTQSAHTVIGTPEFMAPELYEEEYNELVDIYAFGMCMLEMLTFDYPYSECSNTVQIYKKVMEGKKPAALYKVKDPEVRQFIEKCLASVSRRLPARDLLMDPFLKEQGSEDQYYCLPKPTELGDLGLFLREPQLQFTDTNLPPIEEAPNKFNRIIGLCDASIHHKAAPLPSSHPQSQEDNAQYSLNMDLTLKGKGRDARTINLRLRILDNEGRIRNIYFPFDVKGDTAMSVASEMVAELDLTDQDVTKIADMIDEEIIDHFPNWKEDYENCYSSTNAKERGTTTTSTNSSENSLLEFVRTHCCVEKMACTRMECASMHGRFEEVTFHVEGGAEYSSFLAGDAPPLSNGSFDAHLRHHEHDWCNNQSSPTSSSSHSHVSNCNANNNNDASFATKHYQHFAEEDTRHCSPPTSNADFNDSSLSDEDDDDITRNLRLLAIRHQRELRELQFSNEHALLEIEQHLQRQKARRSSNTKCSGCYNPREMGIDSPKKIGCPSMPLSTKVRMECQESSSRNSPRSVLYGGRSPVSSSPNENQKLMKMHSFNDVDSQLYDHNFMSREACKLKRAQTIATYRTDRLREIKRSNASHRIRSISSSSKNLPPKSYTSTNKIQSK